MTNKRGNPRYPEDIGERWEKLYLEEEKSTNAIAKEFNVSSYTVALRLRKRGVAIRTLGEAQRLRVKKGVNPLVLRGGRAVNWKGGKHTQDGYVLLYHPDHPRRKSNGYVRRSVLNWEAAHKVPFPKGWAVHHANGIKDDDRAENLVAYPMLKHSKLIPHLLSRIAALEKENAALRAGQRPLWKEEVDYVA